MTRWVAVWMFLASSNVHADTVAGVPPVPGRGKIANVVDGQNIYSSPLTFRKTINYYSKYLRKKDLRVTAIPAYRYRGVTVARFLSEEPSTEWLAIHVFRDHGRTYIAFVPRTETVDEPTPNR